MASLSAVTIEGTGYVVPQHDWEEPIGVRIMDQLTVCRMEPRRNTRETLTNCRPDVSNMTLYREGMATDHCPPGGVYIGTCDGNLYGGDSWTTIASDLPAIRSVSCEHHTR